MSPFCSGWLGDRLGPRSLQSVEYQRQHFCSTASRIYLLNGQGCGYGPGEGGSSVFVGGRGGSQLRNESLQSLFFPLSPRVGWWLLLTHFSEDTKEVREEQPGQTVTPSCPLLSRALSQPAWSTAPYTHVLLFIYISTHGRCYIHFIKVN